MCIIFNSQISVGLCLTRTTSANFQPLCVILQDNAFLMNIEKIDKILYYIRYTIRILLLLSTFFFFLCSVLLIVYGKVTVESYNSIHSFVLWYLLIFSMWTFIISIPTLIFIGFYNFITRNFILDNIHTEIKYFGICLLSCFFYILLTIFYRHL